MAAASGPDGFVIIDKPAGMTSHDVVAHVRRVLKTRKVGHGGTLDPMATGVLVVGVGVATKALQFVSGSEKSYEATIRLGQTTVTDDAEGDLLETRDTSAITDAEIIDWASRHIGEILQVPSKVSAIKVAGERAYDRVRAGENFELAARPVRIFIFEVTDIRRTDGCVDVDVFVKCGSGTYIRSLARDMGRDLGVGGHLTYLRRLSVRDFTIEGCITLEQLDADKQLSCDVRTGLARVMPELLLDDVNVKKVSQGQRLAHAGADMEAVSLISESTGVVVGIGHIAGNRVRFHAVFNTGMAG